MTMTCRSNFDQYIDNWMALAIAILGGKSTDQSLREIGIPLERKPVEVKSKYTPEVLDDIVTLKNEQGWTFGEIGEKYNVNVTSIRDQYLKELRRRGIKPPDWRANKAERIRIREQSMGADVTL